MDRKIKIALTATGLGICILLIILLSVGSDKESIIQSSDNYKIVYLNDPAIAKSSQLQVHAYISDKECKR
jgi:hypothetical protein